MKNEPNYDTYDAANRRENEPTRQPIAKDMPTYLKNVIFLTLLFFLTVEAFARTLASPDAKAEQRGAVWIPPAAETIAYDAAGNRQNNAQFDYGWDAKNQLVRIRTKNHATAPHAHDITHTYDSEGRRIRKRVLTYANGIKTAETITTFLWDGWDLLYERQQMASGLTLLERRYLWGPDIADGQAGGAGGLLLIRETKGSITTDLIPLYDGTGHITALTDLNKTLHATYAYGPFGEKIYATGPRANTNPWRWASKYLDEETGLYYFGKRYYDPITGQWLSREPLGESESINLYSYCHNDPVNHVDILGLAKYRVDPASKPVLAFDEETGSWKFYLRIQKERMENVGYWFYPTWTQHWDDAGAIQIGGAVGDSSAAQFYNGEYSSEGMWELYKTSYIMIDVMNLESELDSWKTAGKFIPGVGAGIAFAEGETVKGGAFFVRDVIMTVTGTKFMQSGKSLAGLTIRGSALGAVQGGGSTFIDIAANRAQAAWDGETYNGTVSGDAWEVFRGTRNGAVFGVVLGPVARLAKFKTSAAKTPLGARHIASDAPYLDDLLKTGQIPSNARGTYFTLDEGYDALTPFRLQVPHDGAIRVEFGLGQLGDDIAVPFGNWGKGPHLEPVARDFPDFGFGGASQRITTSPIQAERIIDTRTGKVLYQRK